VACFETNPNSEAARIEYYNSNDYSLNEISPTLSIYLSVVPYIQKKKLTKKNPLPVSSHNTQRFPDSKAIRSKTSILSSDQFGLLPAFWTCIRLTVSSRDATLFLRVSRTLGSPLLQTPKRLSRSVTLKLHF
jgi:hypothetical protein